MDSCRRQTDQSSERPPDRARQRAVPARTCLDDAVLEDGTSGVREWDRPHIGERQAFEDLQQVNTLAAIGLETRRGYPAIYSHSNDGEPLLTGLGLLNRTQASRKLLVVPDAYISRSGVP